MLAFEYPDQLMDELKRIELAPYLAVLMRVMRVNEVSVAERNVAVPLALALGATEEITIEAMQMADDPPIPLDKLVEKVPQSLSGCLFRDACRIAWADGSVCAPENTLLGQLADVLGLDNERSLLIRDLVGQIARAETSLRGLL